MNIIRNRHRTIKGKTYREAILRLRRWRRCGDFGPFFPDDEKENLSTKINSRVEFAGDNFRSIYR